MKTFNREDASALAHKEDWQGLLAYAQKWADNNPEHHQAPFYLGVAFTCLGLLEAARSAYERSIAIRSDDANTWDNLAQVVIQTDGFEAAEKYFKMAVSITPSHARAHLNYGISLAIRGRRKDAIPFLRKSHQLAPTDQGALTSLIKALGDEANYAEVRALMPALQKISLHLADQMEGYLRSRGH